MKVFSALVVLAMGSTTAVSTTLGWTSGLMDGTREPTVAAVGPLKFIVTPTVAHPAASVFTITSSGIIFTADAATTCTATCVPVCTGVVLACAVTGTKTILTCTTSAAAITAASAVTIACKDNLGVNPAAGAITFAAVSNLDTSSKSGATNAGYTTGTTLGWTSGLMADTLVPAVQAVGPLTFIVTPTQSHPVASTITITSSAAIWGAAATSTCKVTCATACTTSTLTCTVTTGTILTCTVATLALTASAATIECTTNFAVNPAAGAITFAAVSSLDTFSKSLTNAGYTTVANETNSTNATTTASLLINSAASVVSPGAVAFLLASLY